MNVILFFLISLIFSYSTLSHADIYRWNCSTYEDAILGQEGYEIEVVEQIENYEFKSAVAKTSVIEPLGLVEIAVIPVKRISKTWDPDVIFQGPDFQLSINYLFRDFRTDISKANIIFLNDLNKRVEMTVYCKR